MKDSSPPKGVPWFFLAMRVIGETPALKASEKNILRAMLLWTDKDTGELFPSVPTISRHTSMTDQAVRRVVRNLICKGWVVVVKASRGGVRPNGRGIPNVYRLQLGGPTPPSGHSSSNPNRGTEFSQMQPEPTSAKPEPPRPSTPTFDAPNPNRGTGEPSIHPTKELNQSNPLPVAALGAARVGVQSDGAPGNPCLLHDALVRCGINGRNLEELAAADLTARQVLHEYAQIKADPKVRNPPAVLAKRLGAIIGVDVERPDDEESRQTQRRELLRRQLAELKTSQRTVAFQQPLG